MNAKMKLNLALLAVISALVLVAMLEPGKNPEETVPLARIDVQSVTKIQIAGRQNLTLEKRDGHWRLTKPLDVPANDYRVEQLLKIPAVASEARYPVDAAQLVKFQLAPPNATLTLGDTILEFGGSEPINSQRYVKVGDTLHLVADNFYQHLTAAPSDYVDKKLLPENANIQRIELPGLTLNKDKDGKWSAEPPQTDTAPLYELADAWKNARAYDTKPYSPPQASQAAAEKAKITLVDGSHVEFLILQRQPDATLARADWGLQFQLSEGISKSLLSLQKPEKTDKQEGNPTTPADDSEIGEE